MFRRIVRLKGNLSVEDWQQSPKGIVMVRLHPFRELIPRISIGLSDIMNK